MKTLDQFKAEFRQLDEEIAALHDRRKGLSLEAAELAPWKVGDVIEVPPDAFVHVGKPALVQTVRLALKHGERFVWFIRAQVLKKNMTPTRHWVTIETSTIPQQ